MAPPTSGTGSSNSKSERRVLVESQMKRVVGELEGVLDELKHVVRNLRVLTRQIDLVASQLDGDVINESDVTNQNRKHKNGGMCVKDGGLIFDRLRYDEAINSSHGESVTSRQESVTSCQEQSTPSSGYGGGYQSSNATLVDDHATTSRGSHVMTTDTPSTIDSEITSERSVVLRDSNKVKYATSCLSDSAFSKINETCVSQDTFNQLHTHSKQSRVVSQAYYDRLSLVNDAFPAHDEVLPVTMDTLTVHSDLLPVVRYSDHDVRTYKIRQWSSLHVSDSIGPQIIRYRGRLARTRHLANESLVPTGNSQAISSTSREFLVNSRENCRKFTHDMAEFDDLISAASRSRERHESETAQVVPNSSDYSGCYERDLDEKLEYQPGDDNNNYMGTSCEWLSQCLDDSDNVLLEQTPSDHESAVSSTSSVSSGIPDKAWPGKSRDNAWPGKSRDNAWCGRSRDNNWRPSTSQAASGSGRVCEDDVGNPRRTRSSGITKMVDYRWRVIIEP